MLDNESKGQMPLFGGDPASVKGAEKEERKDARASAGEEKARPFAEPVVAVVPPQEKPKRVRPPKPPVPPAATRVVAAPPPRESRSGLVPEGDVRLTANIRQDLHLRLKIVAAHRRTTIGEIIEELVEQHLS